MFARFVWLTIQLPLRMIGYVVWYVLYSKLGATRHGMISDKWLAAVCIGLSKLSSDSTLHRKAGYSFIKTALSFTGMFPILNASRAVSLINLAASLVIDVASTRNLVYYHLRNAWLRQIFIVRIVWDNIL